MGTITSSLLMTEPSTLELAWPAPTTVKASSSTPSRPRPGPRHVRGQRSLSVLGGVTKRNGFAELLAQEGRCGAEKRFCPCCGLCLDEWRTVETRRGTHHGHALGLDARPAECPRCRTRERHRFSCLAWALEPAGGRRPTVAYFGPQRSHARRLERNLDLDLVRYDLLDPAYAGAYENSTIQADVMDIPRPDRSLDAVIVLHVLEHVANGTAAVSELARVVRPGGFVDSETPCASRPLDGPAFVPCLHPKTNRRPDHGDADTAADDWICDQPDHRFSYSCWYLRTLFEKVAGLRCDCLALDPDDATRFVGLMAFPDWHLRCYKATDRDARAHARLRHQRHRLAYASTSSDSSHSPCLNLSSAPLLTRLRAARRRPSS